MRETVGSGNTLSISQSGGDATFDLADIHSGAGATSGATLQVNLHAIGSLFVPYQCDANVALVPAG